MSVPLQCRNRSSRGQTGTVVHRPRRRRHFHADSTLKPTIPRTNRHGFARDEACSSNSVPPPGRNRPSQGRTGTVVQPTSPGRHFHATSAPPPTIPRT